MFWYLDTLLKESANGKNNTSIWFHYMKKKKSLMEDKMNNKAQKPHTPWNPKRHISLVNYYCGVKVKWWPLAASLGL